jgi:hypothetical protein
MEMTELTITTNGVALDATTAGDHELVPTRSRDLAVPAILEHTGAGRL